MPIKHENKLKYTHLKLKPCPHDNALGSLLTEKTTATIKKKRKECCLTSRCGLKTNRWCLIDFFFLFNILFLQIVERKKKMYKIWNKM